MKVSEIAKELGAAYIGGDAEITSVTYDSRRVTAGCLFC